MTTCDMRNYILDYYKNRPVSKGFKYRVERIMPENQICAIYHSVLRKQERDRKAAEEDKKYHQITIFEYAGGLNA